MEPSCTVYADAPLLEALGGHVVGTDAMTGIQARARAAPTRPMRPGCPARREHAYLRHGTTTRSATCNVATGAVLPPSLGPTRTEAAFADHSARTIATDPDATWRFLADHRNTHQSATLVQLVATHCGRTTDLGVNGQAGVLQSLATRAAFLGDPSQRSQVLSPPTHPSWRNQIARWFSIRARRVRKRGKFASLDALQQRLRDFSTSFNRTATPFRWTSTGRALCR